MLLDGGLRRGAASRAAASCRPPATGRSTRSTRTGSARSAGRRCARSPRSTRRGRPEHGPESLRDRGEPGDARLGARAAGRCTLLLPALVAAVDAFARVRRRADRVLPWLRWLGAWVAPFVAGYRPWPSCSRWSAPRPTPPPAPVPPDVLPLDGPRAWACSAAWPPRACWAACLARFAGRAAGPRAGRAPRARAAVAALALVVSVDRAGALAGQPVRGAARRARRCTCGCWPRSSIRAGRGAACGRCWSCWALLAPLLLALYHLVVLSLDPLAGAWYLLLLVTGGTRRAAHGRWSAACCWARWAPGSSVACRTPAPSAGRAGAARGPSVCGPARYAGPGLAGRHRLGAAQRRPRSRPRRGQQVRSEAMMDDVARRRLARRVQSGELQGRPGRRGGRGAAALERRGAPQPCS